MAVSLTGQQWLIVLTRTIPAQLAKKSNQSTPKDVCQKTEFFSAYSALTTLAFLQPARTFTLAELVQKTQVSFPQHLAQYRDVESFVAENLPKIKQPNTKAVAA